MKTSYPQLTLITQGVAEGDAPGRLQGIDIRRFSRNYNLCNLRNLRRGELGKQL